MTIAILLPPVRAVTLLSVLLGEGCHILMCAPTNVAVQEVAQRFLALIKSSQQPGCQPSQGLYSASTTLFGIQGPGIGASISYGDVVLLASEDRVDEGSEVNLIWSKARAGG
jgi:hypothetical protein